MISHIQAALKNLDPNTAGINRESSVLIPFVQVDGALHVLFERRALTLVAQPGEICFPGGTLEAGESPIKAGIRECMEELNIPREAISILGRVPSVLTSFDMLIHAHVAVLSIDPGTLSPAPEEVESLFTVPFDFFLTHQPDRYPVTSQFILPETFPFSKIPNGKDYNFKTRVYPILFYDYDGRVIWGLTARIIDELVSIVRPTLNTHR